MELMSAWTFLSGCHLKSKKAFPVVVLGVCFLYCSELHCFSPPPKSNEPLCFWETKLCVCVCVFVQLCVPSSHTDSARCFHSFLFSSLSTFFTLLERSSKLEMSKILLAEMEVSSLCKLGLHWWAYSVLGITSPCHKSDCIWVTLQELSPRFESGCPLCQS